VGVGPIIAYQPAERRYCKLPHKPCFIVRLAITVFNAKRPRASTHSDRCIELKLCIPFLPIFLSFPRIPFVSSHPNVLHEKATKGLWGNAASVTRVNVSRYGVIGAKFCRTLRLSNARRKKHFGHTTSTQAACSFLTFYVSAAVRAPKKNRRFRPLDYHVRRPISREHREYLHNNNY